MTALKFIGSCEIQGQTLIFPNVQLDRPTYNEVKSLLEGIGGKWNKKTNGFVFDGNVSDYLPRILDGEKINLRQQFQFFETPEQLCDDMVSIACSGAEINGNILEPSAGRGAIVKSIHKLFPKVTVDVCELMSENISILQKMQNVNFVGEDFMQTKFNKKYNWIFANPPFSNNQDIKHTIKMYDLLADNGVLVVITSKHWMFANDKESKSFKKFVEKNSSYKEVIAAKTFEHTNVETVMLKFKKNIDSYGIEIYGDYIEIKNVVSEIYGRTTAAGNINDAIKTGYLSCGDGWDYNLSKQQINYLKEYLETT